MENIFKLGSDLLVTMMVNNETAATFPINVVAVDDMENKLVVSGQDETYLFLPKNVDYHLTEEEDTYIIGTDSIKYLISVFD